MIYMMIPLCKNPSAIIGFKITSGKPLKGLIKTTSEDYGIKTEEFEQDDEGRLLTSSYYLSAQYLFQFMFDNGCMDEKGVVIKDSLNCDEANNLA